MSPVNRQEPLSRHWLLPPGRLGLASVSWSSCSLCSSSSLSQGQHWPGTSWVSSGLLIQDVARQELSTIDHDFLAKVSRILQHYLTLQFVLYSSSLTDYRVWVLESRVQQQYIICLSILNRNFSADLSSHTSPAFKREAKGVQNMVSCMCHLEVMLRQCQQSKQSPTLYKKTTLAMFWLCRFFHFRQRKL